MENKVSGSGKRTAQPSFKFSRRAGHGRPTQFFHYFVIPLALSFSAESRAKVNARTIEYQPGNTVLEGFLAYDTAGRPRKPGVLIVHEWTGVGRYVKNRAEQLARLGYMAFAADIYGKGVRPNSPKEVAATAAIYKNNLGLLRDRVKTGLEELRRQKGVGPGRISAIGYCFGGMAVL